ncbi:MAG: preQ(1) synthase [Desulfovibrio sp.]|jgi:7-cyano-7-deazaguanine reductase|nr:preQ(1) synthase [Desulfovibrio sp.]
MSGSLSSVQETSGLTKLGGATTVVCHSPDASILETFPNRFSGRDYLIRFEYPEFTSLCPVTGQPDFGIILLLYTPDALCVESKSFKLYMGAFRNHGVFMETIVNTIADDLIAVLAPRRLVLEGLFNVRGGTAISVRVDHMSSGLAPERRESLSGLWRAAAAFCVGPGG